MVARGGIEPPTRGFSAVVAGFRGLIINHLQRLPALSPATPRHIHGTPNLSSTHSWHRASRSAASQLALERCEISGKTERQLARSCRPQVSAIQTYTCRYSQATPGLNRRTDPQWSVIAFQKGLCAVQLTARYLRFGLSISCLIEPEQQVAVVARKVDEALPPLTDLRQFGGKLARRSRGRGDPGQSSRARQTRHACTGAGPVAAAR